MFTLFNTATLSVPRAALILASAALLSRILGLLRDRIFASTFGAGEELDIYFAAFRVPDLIYSIVIGGAISAAFIPVFISHFAKDSQEAWEIARSFFYFIVAGTILLAATFFVIMPFVASLIAPGFDEGSRNLMTTMSRIMLLSPIFLGMSAVFAGVLHSFRKFFIYSLAPIFYNLGIIIGALFFTDSMGVAGLAWGVALGAFLHMVVLLPVTLMSGFSFSPPRPLYHPALLRIFRLMIPRTIGLAAFQINLWVITAIASTLVAGSLTIFNLANNLQYIPIGIIGISFATAVFPALSQSFTKKNYREYLNEFSRTFRLVLFLVIPISVLFFILRAHIVRIVLGSGRFGWEDTRLTAAAVGAFSIGIFAYTLAPVIARAFYAREDTKTPVIANTIGIAVNIALSLIFIYVLLPQNAFLALLGRWLRVDDLDSKTIIVLPVAFSIAGIVALILLLAAFLKNSDNRPIMPDLASAFVRVSIASLIAGFIGWLILQVFEPVLPAVEVVGTTIRIATQASVAAAAFTIVYFSFAFIFRFEELSELMTFVRNKLGKNS